MREREPKRQSEKERERDSHREREREREGETRDKRDSQRQERGRERQSEKERGGERRVKERWRKGETFHAKTQNPTSSGPSLLSEALERQEGCETLALRHFSLFLQEVHLSLFLFQMPEIIIKYCFHCFHPLSPSQHHASDTAVVRLRI